MFLAAIFFANRARAPGTLGRVVWSTISSKQEYPSCSNAFLAFAPLSATNCMYPIAPAAVAFKARIFTFASARILATRASDPGQLSQEIVSCLTLGTKPQSPKSAQSYQRRRWGTTTDLVLSPQNENVRFVQSRNVRFSRGREAPWKKSGSS